MPCTPTTCIFDRYWNLCDGMSQTYKDLTILRWEISSVLRMNDIPRFAIHNFPSPFFSCISIMYARKRRIEAEQRLYNIQQGKVQKPDVYGSRKKPPTVRHHDPEDALFGDVNDDNLVMNSDAVSAAEYLIKINPKSSIPICFVHQIYSILPNNNTVTDRDLVSEYTCERAYAIV